MGNNAHGETETVDQFLDSTLESVDTAEEIAVQVGQKAGFDEDDLNKIAMAVRESMVNAVVHGNRYNKRKRVRFSVTQNSDRLTVKVADEGEGFDYENLPDPLAEENLLRHSGRGIFLMRAFMDEFAIRRLAPAGIEVTLIKYRAPK
ncbi:MAG TPA: ATP-binding protein [Bryobacteraceae bacterium]|nr:ATP-binding protein [Bryobacteraceae bacterium]